MKRGLQLQCLFDCHRIDERKVANLFKKRERLRLINNDRGVVGGKVSYNQPHTQKTTDGLNFVY
jgi:hypothetical protein